jgi:hypothetical protein
MHHTLLAAINYGPFVTGDYFGSYLRMFTGAAVAVFGAFEGGGRGGFFDLFW